VTVHSFTPYLHDALPICSDYSERVARSATLRIVIDRDAHSAGLLNPVVVWTAAPRSYQPLLLLTIQTTESITATSTRTPTTVARSEEHTSELQSRENLVC